MTSTDNFEGLTREDYNNEPVYYCAHCLSLKIKTVAGFDFCDECGGTDIKACHINEWNKMYKDKHGCLFEDN